MKSKALILIFLFTLIASSGCRTKHCAAMQEDFEGYKKKQGKKKRGRQEGLFDKSMKR